MAIEFKRDKFKGHFPPFWRGECKVLPGDFKLKQTFPEGTVIEQGTPLVLDYDNMECSVVKVAKVLAGGTTTKPRVTKGTLFQATDKVLQIGGAAGVVSSIDTSNDDYDEITLSAALTGLTAGDYLVESDGEATPAAKFDGHDSVVETTYKYSAKGFQTVSVGYEVVILKDVAYPIPSDWLTGFSLKKNPSIKYVKQ